MLYQSAAMLAARRTWSLLLAFVLIVGTVTTATRAGSSVHSLIPNVSKVMLDDCADDGAADAAAMVFCAKAYCTPLLGVLPPGMILRFNGLSRVASELDQAGQGLSIEPEPHPPRSILHR
jgi:hypothetical protein